MASFAFVPRKLGNKAKAKSVNTGYTTAGPSSTLGVNVDEGVYPNIPESSQEVHRASTSDQRRTKPTGRHLPDEDYAVLVELELSQYALWVNPDLRRNVDLSDDGYVPLSSLIASSPTLANLDPTPNQATLVRAIRTHSANTLDIRMLVTAPAPAPWHTARAGASGEPGGFEVRRKGGPAVLSAHASFTNAFWDARTVYIENVPPAQRSAAGIARFVGAVLAAEGSAEEGGEAAGVVQHVHLPPHHLDKPGAPPKCKGFAFVTLHETDAVDRLVRAWPWDRRWSRDASALQPPEDAPAIAQDAHRAGFRALPKARWDTLQEEYIAYRARLLREMDDAPAPALAIMPAPPSRVPASPPPKRVPRESPAAQETTSNYQRTPQPPALHPDAPFPPGCLIYARHVHAQTNKTALRALFATALGADAASGGIDYVDYTKGMDSCHLRVASATVAQALAEHFERHPTIQADALDAAGVPPGDTVAPTGAKAIAVELVQGRREEVYWDRVPEKVRRQAVMKALGVDGGGGGGSGPAAQDGRDGVEGGGKRKRRRRA